VAASVARRSAWILWGVVIIAAIAISATAKAGTRPAGAAPYCDSTSSKVFSRWGDLSGYARLYNHAFESGASGWALSGGAQVVSGNEPFYITGNPADSHSLLLPAGSSADSGTVCFRLGDWHMRFLMRRLSTAGSLRVQVIVPGLLGSALTVFDAGTVTGSGSWAPSPRMALLLSNVSSLIGTRAVAFRFTPVGAGASYQIDDVYLDPWKCT
jgi:hypothetical protein